MRNKIILSFLSFCLVFTHVKAAIFIPETSSAIQVTASSKSIYSKDPRVAKEKKAKKVKAEKTDKVDKFAKWGFISSAVGFVSLFFLPYLSFALLPVGIGLSIAGLSATNRNKSRGKGLAIAGLSIGSAGVFLMLLAVVLVLSLISNLN